MKIKNILFVSVFLLTFIIGSVLVFSRRKNSVEKEPEIQTIQQPSVQNETKKPETADSEIIYYEDAKKIGGAKMLDDDYWEKEIEHKSKLLQTGEFHGEEITAKSGETWLGLFEENGQFSLRLEKIKVIRVRDFMDDIDSKEKRGKKVSIKSKSEPFFLINNASTLSEGRVETLFKGVTFRQSDETEGYSTELKSAFTYDYHVGGERYTLQVKKVFNKNLKLIYALILESGKNKQILHVSTDDYLGTLFWVGDLDHDHKPDFFLAPWMGENQSVISVFLSSEAGKNNLVKKVASMWTTGC